MTHLKSKLLKFNVGAPPCSIMSKCYVYFVGLYLFAGLFGHEHWTTKTLSLQFGTEHIYALLFLNLRLLKKNFFLLLVCVISNLVFRLSDLYTAQ